MNWRSGGPAIDSSDTGSDSGSLSPGERFSKGASSDSTTVSISGSESVDTSEPSAESGEEAVSEAAESESSSSVPADRRSYY